MARSLIFTIFLSLICELSFAKVAFEFKGFFPNKVMDRLIQSANGNYKDENIDFAFDVGSLVEGLSVDQFLFNYDLDVQVALSQNGEMGGYFLLKTALLQARALSFYMETISDVNGVKVKIKTEINCGVADLNMKDVGGLLQGSLAIQDGKFSFDKESAEIAFGDFSNVFSVDLKDCTGTKGLESVVAAELQNFIESEEGRFEILDVIVDELTTVINDELLKVQDQGYEVPFVEEMVRVRIDEGLFQERGFIFSGVASYDHEEELYFAVEDEISQRERVRNQAILRLPPTFVDHVLPRFLLGSENLKLVFARENIPGVDVLFNKRLIQFFVWSDLMNFRKNSNFDLGLNLNAQKVDFYGHRDGTLTYNINAFHKTDLDFKNSKGKMFPYMDFRGSLSSTIDFSADPEGVKLVLNNFNLSSNCDWDPQMYSWRKTRPGGKPWMSVILKEARKALNGSEFFWSWKELGIESFKINSINSEFTFQGLDLLFDLSFDL